MARLVQRPDDHRRRDRCLGMTDALDALPDPGSVDDDTPQSQLDDEALQRRWVLEIERYERKAQQFDKRGTLTENQKAALLKSADRARDRR